MSDPAEHPGIQRVREAAARKGVTLDVRVFDESTHTAAEAAAAVGADIGQIVKSLVFVAPSDDEGLEPVLCLVSGPNRVDLARLAAVTGEKDIRRATAREANDLTGFTHRRASRRSVTAVRSGSSWTPTWAGTRSCGPPLGPPTAVFPVSPATLRTLANATVAPVAAEARRHGAPALESSSTPAG